MSDDPGVTHNTDQAARSGGPIIESLSKSPTT